MDTRKGEQSGHLSCESLICTKPATLNRSGYFNLPRKRIKAVKRARRILLHASYSVITVRRILFISTPLFPPYTGAIIMGHYCHICGRVRANEKFSGRGDRDHICKDCQRLPREERDRVTCLDELYGFLEQSHISQKNIDRLGILTGHADPEVCKLANLVLDIARVKPYMRRRLKFLAKNDRNLLLRLQEAYGGDLPEMFGPIDDYL